MIENQGKVVSRAELFDQVWKNQVVSDDTLTRCISDIRLKLSELSGKTGLIETIPKKGYRWVLDASMQYTPLTNVAPYEPSEQVSAWKQVLMWSLSAVLFFMLLSTVVFWGVKHSASTDIVRVALLPTRTDDETQRVHADEFDDSLRKQILSTGKIRFLSSRTIENKDVYPYLSREFAARWIIESRIRRHNNKLKISINLVDAKTALVVDSMAGYIQTDSDDINQLTQKFVELLLLE